MSCQSVVPCLLGDLRLAYSQLHLRLALPLPLQHPGVGLQVEQVVYLQGKAAELETLGSMNEVNRKNPNARPGKKAPLRQLPSIMPCLDSSRLILMPKAERLDILLPHSQG